MVKVFDFQSVCWITKPPRYGELHLCKDKKNTICGRKIDVSSALYEDWDGETLFLCGRCVKMVRGVQK